MLSSIPDTVGVHALLFAVGLVGGMVSGVLGNGIDVLVFSVLVLGFRVSEAIATPTSVILMAGNAVAGALWKGLAGSGIRPRRGLTGGSACQSLCSARRSGPGSSSATAGR